MPRGTGGLDRHVQRRERGPRVAARAGREQLERLVGDCRRVGDAALGLGERAVQEDAQVRGLEDAQLVDLGAREQGGVDLEVGVLRGCSDQGHKALLHGRQERVLLRLVEAVDLVEEEDRRLVGGAPPLLGTLDDGADLRPPGVDGGLLLEGGARGGGDDPCQRRLAGPGRAVEDHRVRLARLDRRAKRGPVPEQMLLPHELVEGAWTHANGQRRLPRRHACALPSGLARVEQPLRQLSSAARPSATSSARSLSAYR